jgi:hypothetical protein
VFQLNSAIFGLAVPARPHFKPCKQRISFRFIVPTTNQCSTVKKLRRELYVERFAVPILSNRFSFGASSWTLLSMEDTLRDSVFGQLVRLTFGQNTFLYPEELDLSTWQKYINMEKSTSLVHHSMTEHHNYLTGQLRGPGAARLFAHSLEMIGCGANPKSKQRTM